MPPIVLTIEVDDKGSPVIKQFAGNAQQATKGFTAGLQDTQRLGDAVAGSITRVVTQIAAFTGATLGIAAGIRTLGDFQQQLANVSTLVDTSKVNIGAFRDAILRLPPALGDSTDLAKGLYQALSAGVAPAQALELVTNAAKLAQAGLTDTKTTVDVLTTAINAYGLNASSTAKLSDQLFETVKIGKTEVKDLASNLGSVIPLAAALGVSFTDLNALVATLTQGGLSTAEAVTAIRSAFSNLIQNAEKFREVGINVQKVISEEGILGLLIRLKAATEGNAEGVRKLIPDVQGLTGVLALLGNQSGTVVDSQKQIAGALGSTDDAVRKQAETIPKALEEVNTAFKQVLLTLGQEFGKEAVDSLHTLRDGILAIRDAAPTIKQALAGTAADILDFAGRVLEGNVALGEFELSLIKNIPGLGGLRDSIRQSIDTSKAYAETLRSQAAEVQRGIQVEIEERAKQQAATTKTGDEQKKLVEITKVLGTQVDAGTASATSFRTSLSGLAGEFGGVKSEASGAGDGVAKLGAKTQDTQSQIGQLLEGVRRTSKELGFGKTQAELFEASLALITPPLSETAKQAGISADSLAGMVKRFTELALPARDLQKQLSDIGITEKQLQSDTAVLTASQIKQADSLGLNADQALALLRTYQELRPALQAQSGVLQAAGVDVAKLSQNISVLNQLTKNYGPTAAEMEAAFKRTFGVGVQESQRFADQLAKDMKLVQQQGTATPEAVLHAFERNVDKIRDLFGKLTPDVAREFDKIAQKAAGVSGDTLLAFRELGEKTPVELQRTADKAIAAFQQISAAGASSFGNIRISSDEVAARIAEIWEKDVRPKIIAAYGQIPNDLLAIDEKMKLQAEQTGKAVAENLGSGFQQAYFAADTSSKGIFGVLDAVSTQAIKTGQAIKAVFEESFADTTIGLQAQIDRTRKELLNIQANPEPIGTVGFKEFTTQKLNEELELLTKKLKDLQAQNDDATPAQSRLTAGQQASAAAAQGLTTTLDATNATLAQTSTQADQAASSVQKLSTAMQSAGLGGSVRIAPAGQDSLTPPAVTPISAAGSTIGGALVGGDSQSLMTQYQNKIDERIKALAEAAQLGTIDKGEAEREQFALEQIRRSSAGMPASPAASITARPTATGGSRPAGGASPGASGIGGLGTPLTGQPSPYVVGQGPPSITRPVPQGGVTQNYTVNVSLAMQTFVPTRQQAQQVVDQHLTPAINQAIARGQIRAA